MRVLGLVFVGTRTSRPEATTSFARDLLGLSPRHVEGSDAVFFDLPDGATLAVQPAGDEPEERTVGLLVEDVRAAVAELRAAGVDVGEVAEAAPYRYAHLRGPDGRLYELVERLPVDAREQSGQDDRSA